MQRQKELLFGSPFREKMSRDCKKAVMTVEAACAVPLFLFTMICIISIMNLYGMILDKEVTLRNQAEAAALVYAGEEEKWIDLTGAVSFRPYYMPGAGATLFCTGKARAWNGRDDASAAQGRLDTAAYVYVTDYESVYHTNPACGHIELSISRISSAGLPSARNADGKKYCACEKCVGSGAANASVYVTEYGECYHNSLSCGGLTRSVRLVSADEVCDLEECSGCAQHKASGS